MAIDARIALGIQAPKFDNPLSQLAQIQQVRSAQQQNRLAEMTLGQKQQAIDYQGKQRNALTSALNPDGSIDDTKYRTGLAGIGDYEGLQTFETNQATKVKATREAEKAQLETAMKQQGIIAQYAGAAKDQTSWSQSLADLQAMGVDVSKVPPQFDPQTAAMLRDRALTGAQQLEQKWKAMDFGLKKDEFAYRQQNDATNRNVTMRGQDMSQSTAIRGQNMTNQRGIEANRLKGEENAIARGEKAKVENMTKSSQIASFDTMLGTLGRLGEHPGLSRSVGLVGALPTMPGSESANFQAELESFQSQAFIPMVSQLKGMGALSDAEGKKLTAAVGALNPKMGEKAFRDSVGRITADMEAAKARVSGTPAPSKAPTNAGPQPGTVQGGYRFKGGNPADPKSWEKM